jgi:hypothetical protein
MCLGTTHASKPVGDYMGIKNNAKLSSIILGFSFLGACSMQQGSSFGIVSNEQSFCSNREYLADDGYVSQHPADAASVESYDHYFCGTIKLHLQDNSITLRIDQIVRDYGGGGVSVLARTADMEELVEVQYISPATMDDAIYALENGESAELKNISGGSTHVEEYVEWALAVPNSSGGWEILNQDSYFIACNDTAQRCANTTRAIKAKSWVQASDYLRL